MSYLILVKSLCLLCNNNANNESYDLCILFRYGWIPSAEEVGEGIQQEYDWVNDCSITTMEILYGAYRLVMMSLLLITFITLPTLVFRCQPTSLTSY